MDGHETFGIEVIAEYHSIRFRRALDDFYIVVVTLGITLDE